MIRVMGAGAYGGALAVALALGGKRVSLWARDPAQVEAMRRTRRLPRLDAALPDGVAPTADPDPGEAEAVLMAVPAQALRGVLDEYADVLAGRPLVACCKGIDLETLTGPSALLSRVPEARPAILTGPSFAAEIARGLPTALTLAAEDGSDLQHLAVGQRPVGQEPSVQTFPAAHGAGQRVHLREAPRHRVTEGEDGGVHARREVERAGRMVEMGMGDEHCLHPPARGRDHGALMRLVARSGIDHGHRPAGPSDQVGVGARPGQRRRVAAGHAKDVRRDGDGGADLHAPQRSAAPAIWNPAPAGRRAACMRGILDWLHQHMPRGLYGRAALILLLPVILLQSLVGYVFIQRFYEDVSRQMTQNVARPLAEAVRRMDGVSDEGRASDILADRAEALGLVATLGAAPVTPYRDLLDISGRAVVREFAEELPSLLAVDLESQRNLVRVGLGTRHGPVMVAMPRRYLSPRNPHQLLVIMGFATAVLTAVSYLFLKNQLRPVRRLAEAAEAFGRGRVMPFRPAGATEMRQAGQAFLDMRARIERAGQQRTMMLSGVSHDLRTPLTRMRLALSMMDDAEAGALLDDVAEMEGMIGAFLDYARLEAVEAPRPVDPSALVREVAEGARRAGQAVEVAEPLPGGMRAPLRRDVLARALSNLVGNAVRYGTRARLGLTAGRRAIVFCVEDDGPGIPPDQREAAMRPFERLDAARSQSKGAGVGLGLAVAGDVARLHGGALRLGESESMGGLKAEIVIPL